MYTEWISLSPKIEANSNGAQSVLNKFSGAAGREVSVAIVKQLASSLGLTQPAEPNSLAKTLNDDEVKTICIFILLVNSILNILFRYYGV